MLFSQRWHLIGSSKFWQKKPIRIAPTATGTIIFGLASKAVPSDRYQRNMGKESKDLEAATPPSNVDEKQTKSAAGDRQDDAVAKKGHSKADSASEAGDPSVAPSTLTPSSDNTRVSAPGAWGVQPTRRIESSDSSSSGLSQAEEDVGNDDDHGNDNNDDDLLIKAELVNEERQEEPRVLVDAQMWDEEMAEMKLRRRRIVIGTVLIILIIIVVITLSVALTGRNDGSTIASTETQTVLASSSPTLSEVPSPSPSLAPSGHPSEMPSQSPTSLKWNEIQRLDGVIPEFLPFGPETVQEGGQEFGNTIHISTVTDTPLGNRTGREYLVVGTHAGSAQYANTFGGPPFSLQQSSVVYLCGGVQAEGEAFCELQTTFVPPETSVAADLSGTTFVTAKTYFSGDLHDLSNIDSFNTSSPYPEAFLFNFFEPSLAGDTKRTSVAVTADASRVISITRNEQWTSIIQRSPPEVVSKNVTLLTDNSENFYAMALRESTLITILGLNVPPFRSCTTALCQLLSYDGFAINRDDVFLTDQIPLAVPQFVAGEGTSLFSHTGLAVNGDASIVAVSSAVEIGAMFQVNVFQWVNSTEWEPMGSTIFGPNPGDFFGSALALNEEGDFLVVGAPSDATQGTDNGRVYSFTWDGEDWAPFGDPLEGAITSKFGSSLDLSANGDLLVVGSPESDANGVSSGEVVIYELTGF